MSQNLESGIQRPHVRRNFAATAAGLMLAGALTGCSSAYEANTETSEAYHRGPEYEYTISVEEIIDKLGELAIKGRAPKTGYEREEFGSGWTETDSCDMRNRILERDLVDVTYSPDGCKILSGTLPDPYTGKTIPFVRGETTSDDMQIDHVVALSNAWQTGAQQLDVSERVAFANDPRNLTATEGRINQQKGDADAATWLPPNRAYRCNYVARQVLVKHEYDLWVTPAEHDAMLDVLDNCDTVAVPH